MIAPDKMTVDEFLHWDDGTDMRYQLIRGVPVAIAVPGAAHSLLLAALAAELHSALRPPTRHTLYGPLAIVPRMVAHTCYIADLAVSSEPLRAKDAALRDPLLLVEVLSSASEAFDRGTKLTDYRDISSVQEILLIHSEIAFAEIHRRDRDRWNSNQVAGADKELDLGSVGVTLTMAKLYEGVPLDGQMQRSPA